MNPMTSGRQDIYDAIGMLQKIAHRLPESSKDRLEVEAAIRKLYRGTYLNEEQLQDFRLPHPRPPLQVLERGPGVR